MGQSLVRNLVHFVFSTKNREALIFPPVEEKLHQYLGGICNGVNSPVIKVGGYHDHVHILCSLSKHLTVIDLMQEVKTESSKWIKTQGEAYQNFHWQDGYGAFSVGFREVDRLVRYIENQKQHHGLVSFQEEFRQFLKAYGLPCDERYVWS